MGRPERTDHFERLCDLRAGYGSRPDDRRGVFSIEDLMIYAQAVMDAVDETADEESTSVDETADEESTSVGGHADGAVMTSGPHPSPISPRAPSGSSSSTGGTRNAVSGGSTFRRFVLAATARG
jgi:hypothetical protein